MNSYEKQFGQKISTILVNNMQTKQSQELLTKLSSFTIDYKIPLINLVVKFCTPLALRAANLFHNFLINSHQLNKLMLLRNYEITKITINAYKYNQYNILIIFIGSMRGNNCFLFFKISKSSPTAEETIALIGRCLLIWQDVSFSHSLPYRELFFP